MRRALLVFVCVWAVLATIAGGRLWQPGKDNHFVHMAAGWLEGRTHLPGKPPHGNDWGRVTRLELRDGRTVHGYRCVTAACKAGRKRGTQQWQTPRGVIRVERDQVESAKTVYTVTFPPGPAAVLLPGVALFGMGLWDLFLTSLLGALAPALLVRVLDRMRDRESHHEHLWAAAAFALGSPWLFVAANGSVWFTAQVLGGLCLLLYGACAWQLRAPVWAAVWFGCAVSCRVSMACSGVLLLHQLITHRARARAWVTASLPIAAVAIALASFNYARFGHPLEFGHTFLDIRWQPRMQEIGLFSWRYFLRNLEAFLWLLPSFGDGLRFSIHGVGLAWTMPWLAVASLPLQGRMGDTWILWVAGFLALLPGLFYQNTGQFQFSYRFVLDALPLWTLALALGGGFRPTVYLRLAIAWSIAAQTFGAWVFTRSPGPWFRWDGWPFPG